MNDMLNSQVEVLVNSGEIDLTNAMVLARVKVDKQLKYIEAAKIYNRATFKRKILDEDLNPEYICATEGCNELTKDKTLCENCSRMKQGLAQFLRTTGGMNCLKVLLHTAHGLKVQ